ncbi:dUTP diphosphatase [Pseudobacillus sp. FSL P4-0506]|uniref:dUTP diphosphatase n=1 Tax=Pseudobacillus sp. FSL P4-0506 TaxID=2921576 RepID=UPI0030F82E54
MNLTKLFEMQKVLDERIMDEHPELRGQDNLDWKTLALQVELGECANEWRGFKKWSHDQEPRTAVICESCRGSGGYYNTFKNMKEKKNKVICKQCNGWGVVKGANPLLEEYVDCLHFILSIGVECKWNGVEFEKTLVSGSITTQFHHLFKAISDFQQLNNYLNYKWIWGIFNGLGQMLGFTWEQIEESYMAKNKINHLRQENGY